MGQVSGLKNLLDVALRVIADSCRRNVGNRPLAAFRIGTAGEALAGDDRAESIARAHSAQWPGPLTRYAPRFHSSDLEGSGLNRSPSRKRNFQPPSMRRTLR